MSGRDILAVLAMIAPSFTLIVAIAFALAPTERLTASAEPAAQGPQGTPEERLLSAPGLASLFLLAFGGIAGMLGLGMLVTGRRSAGLMTLLLVLFGVFMATGIAVALSLRG